MCDRSKVLADAMCDVQAQVVKCDEMMDGCWLAAMRTPCGSHVP